MIYLGDKAVGINNDNRDLKLMSTVTIAESLENDTTGNAKAVYNNYIYDIVKNITPPTVIVVIAVNNAASAYALYNMIFTATFIDNMGIVLRKTGSNFTSRLISSTTSAWCSSGTVLYIYQLKEVTPNA